MALSTIQIRNCRRDFLSGKYPAGEIFEVMVVGSLSPMQVKVYHLIELGEAHSSREVADKLKISVNNASNLLRFLFEMDLLVKSFDEQGKPIYHAVEEVHA